MPKTLEEIVASSMPGWSLDRATGPLLERNSADRPSPAEPDQKAPSLEELRARYLPASQAAKGRDAAALPSGTERPKPSSLDQLRKRFLPGQDAGGTTTEAAASSDAAGAAQSSGTGGAGTGSAGEEEHSVFGYVKPKRPTDAAVGSKVFVADLKKGRITGVQG